MTYPTDIKPLAIDYNLMQGRLSNVLGLTTSGWGAVAIYSQPVTSNTMITALQWNSLIDDLNVVMGHITNVSTTTAFITTSAQVITTSTGVEIDPIIELLWSTSTVTPPRYICHPEQYVLDPTTSTVRPALFITSSTRTTSWGIDPVVIHHNAVATFITRLQAYYYFNLGNYLVWKPYLFPADVGYNDLDQEWIRWINWINNDPTQEFRYARDDFLGNTPPRVYTSGTLKITVEAIKRPDEKNIDFNITYENEATSLLVVLPSVAGYTITI